jgi:hypothetical protein
MNFALEFHDSEVRRVAADGDTLRVEFSAAAVHRQDGDRGWLSTVVATLSQAAWTGELGQAFGKLGDGSLRVAGTLVPRPALPAEFAGDIALTLRFANGTVLAAQGRALAWTVADEERFTPDHSC